MPEFSPMGFSLNDLASLSPMKDAAMGIYGSALSPEMKSQMMPMGMMNRDGQAFMGQQQPQQPAEGMSGSDMMKMASMAMQGFNRGQQGIQAPTQQIMRDSNQFRFPQQAMAQALRRR